jgi:uncharacterized membrane protein
VIRVRSAVLAAFILFAFFALGTPARAIEASDFQEHIEKYDVTMTVASDGKMQVQEVIAYNFGVVPKHGIFRDIPLRETYGTDGKFKRVYKIDVNKVTATNASAQTSVSNQGNYKHIRIGDPDRTVTGTHTYTIDYTVTGAMTGFADHDELNWDAIGLQWPVPITRATVRVTMPAEVQQVACFWGPPNSKLPCALATKDGTHATFSQTDLGSNEGLTAVIGIPKGYINPPPKPMLERNWNLDDAFARRANTIVPGGLLAVLGIGAVIAIAWRRGRDRRYQGSAVDQAMGNIGGADETVPLFQQKAGPVEFIPPDKVRPGEVGVLIDEEANLLDVTATIVDLAVRGYLSITELPPEGLLRRRHDYQLDALPVDGKKLGELFPYEQEILTALFKTGPQVKLSDLKYKFRTDLSKITDAMYNDTITKGWFIHRPDRVRMMWHGIGIGVVIIGGVATYFLAAKTTFGLLGLAIVLIGFALLIAANHMPARTAKGSALLSRIRGFRRLFDEGDEDLRSRFAEQHHIFSEYLPYAIVFGCTEKWAKAFEGLDAEELGTANWYGGHAGLNALIIASALDDFGTVATGTLYASQPSSSSSSGFGGGGFSGGGGGGGGGGSW